MDSGIKSLSEKSMDARLFCFFKIVGKIPAKAERPGFSG